MAGDDDPNRLDQHEPTSRSHSRTAASDRYNRRESFGSEGGAETPLVAVTETGWNEAACSDHPVGPPQGLIFPVEEITPADDRCRQPQFDSSTLPGVASHERTSPDGMVRGGLVDEATSGTLAVLAVHGALRVVTVVTVQRCSVHSSRVQYEYRKHPLVYHFFCAQYSSNAHTIRLRYSSASAGIQQRSV